MTSILDQTTFPPLDYTSRSQAEIFSDILDRIPWYLPEWTDLSNTDPGIAILKEASGLCDILHWNIDRMAQECFIDTCLSRSSAIRLAKLIGYSPQSASPAGVDLTFTLSTVYADDVTIPAGTQCQSGGSDPVTFETDEELVIPAGDTEGTVGAFEGEVGSEDVTLSNGLQYQTYALEDLLILDGSLRVFIDEGTGGVEWAIAESFIDATPTSEIFVAEKNPDGTVQISFGDNFQGKVPVANAPIRAEYRVGGGTRGNVGARTIATVVSQITLLGSPITVTVINDASATGGGEEETTDEIRVNAPLSLRSRWGLITAENYASGAEQVTGVAKAYAVSDSWRGCIIYISPDGGGLPSQALKDEVFDYIDPRTIVTIIVTISDPVYIYADAEGTVNVFDNYGRAEVQTAVEAKLATFFDFDSRDFGQSVRLSDIYRAIDEVAGVDWVDLTYFMMAPLVTESAWSGDAVIEDFVREPNMVSQIWTVTLTSATEFSVTGSVSGLQSNVGTVDSPYLVDNTTFGFTINSGVDPLATGDNVTIKVSNYLGSIIAEDYEIVLDGTFDLSYAGGS